MKRSYGFKLIIGFCAGVFLLTLPATAGDIIIPDGDFDDSPLGAGEYAYVGEGAWEGQYDYPGPWQSSGGDAWFDNGYYLAAGDDLDLPALSGTNKLYGNDGAEDYVYQMLDATFVQGVTYTLSAYVGQPWAGYDSGWWLYLTGEDFTSDLAEASGIAPESWQQVSVAYTATAADAGKKIGVKLRGDQYVAFESVTLSENTLASKPSPVNEQTDLPRDVQLGWEAGGLVAPTNGHRVYFGQSLEEVTNATGATGQTETSYDPGILDFGQTYYWRVDEVKNASTVYTGDVWSFTVEPYSIPVETIIATASAFSPGMEASKTVDGSGLNELDQHVTTPTDMWVSGPSGGPVWIQYEFDKPYKLHEMLVWNSNQVIEAFAGFGAKEVLIEISLDGATWTALEGVPEFAQASGSDDYSANTTVDFAGSLAKYVKLTMVSGYGLLGQFGLSEVRFLHVPTYARQAQPADGAVDVPVDALLSWRAGREAVSHEVYLGTDPDALPLTATTQETSYQTAGLDYDSTYFWKIVEVNDAADPAAYVGSVWSFQTSAYTVVDNFDQYDDDCNRLFFGWLDGLGHNGSDTCGVNPYNGNGTGSIVGNAEPPFAERTIVRPDSTQSMPLMYDNSAASSEVVVNTDDLAIGRDWSMGSPTTLTLWFYGDPNNAAAQLYVKVGSTKIDYAGDADALTSATWTQWNIDLAGINLSNVSSLTIGLDRIGSGTGIVYIDDIRLYGAAPEIAANVQINGVFNDWSDHPDAGARTYVTLIRDEPGGAWHVHAPDDGRMGLWLDDAYSS